MDPDLDASGGLLDSHNGILDPHPHAHHLSRLDVHDPSNAPVSYSTANHDSASAANTNAQVLAHHAAATLEPDDFYKSYRALSPKRSEPESLPMASSVPQPALRPNSDGTNARHLQLPTNRNPGRQNLRSVSSPLDSRSAVTSRSSQAGQPSVKDLKKRFDQKSGTNSIPRLPLRQDVPAGRLRQDPAKPKPQSSSAAYTNLRSGTTPASSRETQQTSTLSLGRSQRPKFVAQDQVSSSSQSFASRVGKPPSSANGNSIATKSMTHLPPKSPPQASQSRLPSPNFSSRSPGLLFGEIPPELRDPSAAGFGINNFHPRRTSDSSLHGLVGHQRSFSDPDAEPTSPSSWYRDVHANQEAAPKAHGRSHSDVSIATSAAPAVRKRASESSTLSASNLPTTASRLPVSIRRLNSPTNSSPSSTRSNSPSTFRRSQVNGKALKTGPPIFGMKTPTQPSRKPPPSTLVTPISSNTRLQAYIGTGPSKLSPPLRSSRPRQPVSLASTASSRMKETAKPKSPTKANAKDSASSRANDSAARRSRKISVGPIDFEQRREHIRLAYTKSIRESQAFEARQKAVERRQKEMDAAAKAKISAAAAAASSVPTAAVENDITNEDSAERDTSIEARTDPSSEPATEPAINPPIAAVPETTKSPAPPLKTATDLISEHIIASSLKHDEDLPALSVPGSFPDLTPPISSVERRLSAVSVASATTEFDVEPQTEPPVSAQSLSNTPITFTQSPDSQILVQTLVRTGYQYPFEDQLLSPRQLPTNHTTLQSSSETAVAQRYRGEHVVPGAYCDENVEDDSFVSHTERFYQTSVTILPQPHDVPTASREAEPTTPFSRLDIHDESDCHSELDSGQVVAHNTRHEIDDAATDACTEEIDDDRDGMEERQSSYRYDDNPPSRRASTCGSSDVETFDDLLYPSYDQQSTADSSNRLMVPPSSSRSKADRLSQLSAWTDFSLDSLDTEALNSSRMQIEQSSAYDQSAVFEPDDSSLRSIPYDESGIRLSNDSTLSSTQFNQQHLPNVDTGEEFSIPYLTPEPSTSLSYLPSPSHEPPPVPGSRPGSILESRPSSVFYEQSHYDSILINSEGGSAEFISQLETPQSMDLTTSDTADHYFGSQTPADSDTKSFVQQSEELSDKERHRLVQRRNVIKELVDTEAVFVRDMNIVEEIYKGTAEACPNLDSKTVKLIFRNSDDIIEFHTSFLAQIKEVVAGVYVPKIPRTPVSREDSLYSEPSQISTGDISDTKDRATSIGPVFQTNIEKMKLAHEGFLRNSDQAAKRLIQIQLDPAVKVWLNECNEVAKDLTAAWDLDSLLIKPMQRLTKYPNLIITLLQHTPQDHPDREALVAAKEALEEAIIEINKTKKNFELVGQIVGRKRKESDVKAGLARAFGKRVDKLQGGNRPPEDPVYAKLEERFSDDYLRLQVVLRDVEFYTRQTSSYVHEFLQYMSAIELVMRLQPGNYPELESKWVQFNISLRDLEKVALEQHLAQVRKHVIEPFEHVIKAYGNPSLAMKKRQKRRVVYERSEQLKRAGKTVDPKLKELVEQYEALNDTLIKELPKLSALTEKVGNICLGNFINIQANWYAIWKEKMKSVLSDAPEVPDLEEIVATFQRDFPYARDQLTSISIINPTYGGRVSQSTTTSVDDAMLKARSRPSETETRGRGRSISGESAPVLPAPDFGKRHSGSFTLSPGGSASGSGAGTGTGATAAPSPHQYYYRDFYSNVQNYQPSLASPRSPEVTGSSRSLAGTGQTSTRPSTGRSFDSTALPRQSTESAPQNRRDSNTTYNSAHHQPQEGRRYSNLFHSALPLPDGPEESQRSSRASSRERAHAADGYNILWLAASLFEFNIATTKHEAGYPYLTYQAGEIFDVIAEKGELWLAKNQDDPTDQVGWIWSKHFAKLADS